MSVFISRPLRRRSLAVQPSLRRSASPTAAAAQNQLPEVVVTAPKETTESRNPSPLKCEPRRARHRRRSSDRTCARCATGLAWGAAQCQSRNLRSGAQQPLHHRRHVVERHDPTTIQRTARRRQHPGRANPAAVPRRSQDSAASGLLHVRNDHANLQFRINGVQLPDGLTGFGSILDASWIGSMALVVGALPAEYGLRTVGLVDITTRTDSSTTAAKSASTAAAKDTITPTIQYGGTFGSTCPTITTGSGNPRLAQRGLLPGRPVLLSPAVIWQPTKASRIRSPPTARSTISRNREKASPTCRRSSTRIRGSV